MTVSFIAEVSSNHNRDINRSLAFIEKASEIGCDGVKFQLFRIEELFAPEILAKSKEHSDRRKWELPLDYLAVISDKCRDLGIKFACTPFYLEAVNQLYPYVDIYKIASYELLWDDLLRACASTGKPVILSTGMATFDEVRHAVNELRNSGCKSLTLLHCSSSYPTQALDCNLAAIETLRNEFLCPSGWSDHSVDPCVIFRAVHRWNASLVEFHMDLDGTGVEYKIGHCWLPSEIKSVISGVRKGFLADGEGEKIPSKSEMSERELYGMIKNATNSNYSSQNGLNAIARKGAEAYSWPSYAMAHYSARK
jgi:sialic acid synthase SpsE